MTTEKASLLLRQGFFADTAARAAYAALMRQVFEIDIEQRDAFAGVDPTCRPFAFFDPQGVCVASAEVFAIPLMLDGLRGEAWAVRLVAVAEPWRGRGLFRALMLEALAWCDETVEGPILLYTEESSLYERFGFRDVPQHKVMGAAPPVEMMAAARRLSLARESDVALIRRLLATRAPVSDHVAIVASSPLFLVQVAANDDVILDYAAALDALIVSKQAKDRLTLVDIVAATIPSLASVLSVLGRAAAPVDVLFPPDKLGWHGTIRRDDTGLMMRGPAPSAFDRPFMLPPTTEF